MSAGTKIERRLQLFALIVWREGAGEKRISVREAWEIAAPFYPLRRRP